MLTHSEFAARWNATVAARDSTDDSRLLTLARGNAAPPPGLPDSALLFLTQAGLPASCAPCLSFDEVAAGLPHLWDVFSPGQWREDEISPLRPYRMLGSDGAGNPLCLDTRTGHVLLLDHEADFKVDRFVNSSVAQLAESLLLFHTVRPNALPDIRHIDAAAAEEGAFWHYETAARFNDAARPAPADPAPTPLKPWWKFW